jgi:hypothetical protein
MPAVNFFLITFAAVYGLARLLRKRENRPVAAFSRWKAAVARLEAEAAYRTVFSGPHESEMRYSCEPGREMLFPPTFFGKWLKKGIFRSFRALNNSHIVYRRTDGD